MDKTGRPMLFFDLDGTLTDPAPGITACIRHAAAGLGVDDVANPEQYIGPPLRESFRCILATMDPDVVESAMRLYRERFATVGLFENALYPGITELLGSLHARGHAMRVVTSKPTIYADRIIDHFALRPFFPRVYGSELDGRLSDKGELIASVLECEESTGTDPIMIGDRRHDILGAKKNGLRTIGVEWGYGLDGELQKADADGIADRVADLTAVIEEIEQRPGEKDVEQA